MRKKKILGIGLFGTLMVFITLTIASASAQKNKRLRLVETIIKFQFGDGSIKNLHIANKTSRKIPGHNFIFNFRCLTPKYTLLRLS